MSTKKLWEKGISRFLVGKTIKKIRYLTKKEADDCGFFKMPIVIIFTDESYMFPMSDDEGNDGGAIATSSEELPTIPVM
tara:strand:+ start:621 stop:857 length:237 start_codon:yes stop_codon:yes gene_type:complete